MRNTTLAVLLALAACDSPDPIVPPEPPPPHPEAIVLYPTSMYFDSVGATDTLTATVFDQYGEAMTVSVTWTSQDATVAVVDGGIVTAIDNGLTRIVCLPWTR